MEFRSANKMRALDANTLNRDPQDLTTLMLIGKEVLSSRTFEELCDNALNYLPRLFDAQGCALTPYQDGTFDLRRGAAMGPLSQPWQRYSEHYYKLDPLVRAPFMLYPYKVYVTTDIISEELLERSEFYNEFLKPICIRSHLFINLSDSSGQLIGSFVATRDRKSEYFDSREKSIALMLEPYLSNALEKTIVADENRRQEDIIDCLLGRMATKGVMILDSTLRPIHMNRSSELILSKLYKAGESHNILPATLARELEARTRETLKAAKGGETNPVTGSFALTLPGGHRTVRVSLTTQPGAGRKSFFLFVTLECKSLLLSPLLKDYLLTNREIEIVCCIDDGMRNSQIAESLCISERTVSNHVSHIFEKLEVTSRTALLQLLLELAS